MQYLIRKASWFPIIAAIVFGVGVIVLGSYYTWPNLEAINESRARWVGIWNAWEQAAISTDGRYTTNFLHRINPLAFGWMLGYKVMPVIGLIFFIGSFWFFLSAIVKSSVHSFLAVLLFAIVHFAVSPSITNELYSMLACFVYLYSVCFWLLWTGAAIRSYTTAEVNKGNLWFFVSALFLVASTGSSEMFLIVNPITMAAVICLASLKSSVARVLPLVTVGVFSVLFFFVCSGSMQRIQSESQSYNTDIPVTRILHWC